jgi:cytochrome b
MKHIKSVSMGKAAVSEKGFDPAGAAFFQIWLAVFTWIITGAFSSKN